MAVETVGKLTIVGSADEIKNTKLAFTEGTPAGPLPAPIPMVLVTKLRIQYFTAKEMTDNGWVVPGTKSPQFPKGRASWGQRVNGKLLAINSTLSADRPRKARHVIRHEVGHDVDGDFLAVAPIKRQEIMATCMVDTTTGKPPVKWNPAKYEDASEGFADGFAHAISGIQLSAWDYDVIVKPDRYARLLEIVFRPVVNPDPPVIEPPTPPTPPVDPCANIVAELAATIAERDATIASQAGVIADQETRITELTTAGDALSTTADSGAASLTAASSQWKGAAHP